MKLKKWTALALSAALATCMLTSCPWDDDDAASSDLSASSSRPSHDGGSDEDDSGSTGGGTGGETAVNQYTVTVTIGANGTVTYNNNTYSDITNKTVQVDEGTMLTFTVMPEEKYTVTVTAGGTTLNPTNGVYSYTVNADCSITVKFEDLGYTITTDENGKETYNVHDETGLKAWAKVADDTSANCKLTENITLPENYKWPVVGTSEDGYAGIFDGNDKTITGLTAYDPMFFKIGSNGVVKDLTLENVNIEGINTLGGITVYNEGKILNCKVTGKLEAVTIIGGIAAYNYDGTITNCHFKGTISSISIGQTTELQIGGIVGDKLSDGTIESCTYSYTYNDKVYSSPEGPLT